MGTNDCTICGLDRDRHTAGPCPWCGLAIEHHSTASRGGGTTEGTPDDCRAGKARMAAARRPEDRTDVDRLSLAGEAS